MLSSQRERINQIDQQLVQLFEQRMQVAAEVAQIKHEHGLPILDAQREALVYDRTAGYLTNQAFAPALHQVYDALMAVSRAYQHELVEQWQQNELK